MARRERVFTGLIQKIGRAGRLAPNGGGWVLSVTHDAWETPLVPGESVAVQGVCVTVRDPRADGFRCDLLEETVRRTMFASLRAGSPVNLERAMRAEDRFGGHVVTGHVDGTAKLLERRRAARDWVLRLGCERHLMEGIVAKGSVACDGVSLTVADMSDRWFEVHIIPTTWTATAFSGLREGDLVNIETDILGKYVKRCLDGAGVTGRLDEDTLRKAGFMPE